MITPKKLADSFALNTRIIQMQTEDLRHADSLVQTPYNINSLNWVLGHIAVNRDRVLSALGEATILSENETSRYKRGSEPVQTEDDIIIPLERLVEIIVRGQELITATLSRQTPGQLAAEIQIHDSTTTLAERLFGIYFHDTYHTGQTDLLRQVSGKNDRVIP